MRKVYNGINCNRLIQFGYRGGISLYLAMRLVHYILLIILIIGLFSSLHQMTIFNQECENEYEICRMVDDVTQTYGVGVEECNILPYCKYSGDYLDMIINIIVTMACLSTLFIVFKIQTSTFDIVRCDGLVGIIYTMYYNFERHRDVTSSCAIINSRRASPLVMPRLVPPRFVFYILVYSAIVSLAFLFDTRVMKSIGFFIGQRIVPSHHDII